MTEEWRPIKGYEGYYEVSNQGRVRSITHEGLQRNRHGGESRYIYPGKIIRPNNSRIYPSVTLNKAGSAKTFKIHRLVAIHFLPAEEGKPQINHKDANPKNNDADNLEWCTQSYNIQYAYDNKTKIPPHMRVVGQYTDDWQLVKTWRSVAEACRGTRCKNIAKVCNGEREHAGGYRWKYL